MQVCPAWHWEVVKHCTQVYVGGALQCDTTTYTCVQLAEVRHRTQSIVAVLQTDVLPWHWVSVVHWMHAWVVVSHVWFRGQFMV
jgi:hypothetical protein